MTPDDVAAIEKEAQITAILERCARLMAPLSPLDAIIVAQTLACAAQRVAFGLGVSPEHIRTVVRGVAEVAAATGGVGTFREQQPSANTGGGN